MTAQHLSVDQLEWPAAAIGINTFNMIAIIIKHMSCQGGVG